MRNASKVNNIQVLRAFAASAVLVLHTNFRFPGLPQLNGFGVDVFFVISGYIMARILDQEGESSPALFLRRRILRIVPPYWALTFAVFFLSMGFPELLHSTRPDLVELVKSLFFVPFVKEGSVMEPILFVGWSLNYEMFFYFALALGMVIWRARGALAGSILVVFVVLLCNLLPGNSAFVRFYGSPRSIEFVLGIACYAICRRAASKGVAFPRGVLLAVCILSSLGLVLSEGLSILPAIDPATLVAVVVGALSFLVVLTANLLSLEGWDSRSRRLVLLGDASYILYLIHPYSVDGIHLILGKRLTWLRTDTWSGMLISVAVSIVLAIVVHFYVERPTVRFLNSRFGGRRPSTEFLEKPQPAVVSN